MDVVFPVMPFADVGRPSIGVSLLHAAAQRLGASSRVLYFNLDFAVRCGLARYNRIAGGFPPDSLFGEWLFSDQLFGKRIPEPNGYVREVLARIRLDQELLGHLFEIRADAARFIAGCVAQIRALRPRVVGSRRPFTRPIRAWPSRGS